MLLWIWYWYRSVHAKVSVKQVWSGLSTGHLVSPECQWSASAHAVTSCPMVSGHQQHIMRAWAHGQATVTSQAPTDANYQGHSIIPSESVISGPRQQVQRQRDDRVLWFVITRLETNLLVSFLPTNVCWIHFSKTCGKPSILFGLNCFSLPFVDFAATSYFAAFIFTIITPPCIISISRV